MHDQWLLGDDLLVAPVLSPKSRSRDIYLPEGIWKDEIDGYFRKGGKWLYNYQVPLTKVPYFALKPIREE